jgi:hypothetical protein
VIRGTLRALGYTLLAAALTIGFIACAGGGFLLGITLAILRNG